MRKQLGHTQQDLAEVLGTTRQEVCCWERGRHKPGRMAQNLLRRMAKAVGYQPTGDKR